MFQDAKLVLQHYVPDDLLPGMWFATKKTDIVLGKVYEYIQVYELTTRPNDEDAYISEHGYPVQPFIVQEYMNPDDKPDIIVDFTQIGWFDAGDEHDEMEDITIAHVNTILDDYDGDIILEVDEEGDPLIYEGKCTIRYADNWPMGEDDDMDYEDPDDEPYEEIDEDWSDDDEELKNDLYERDN